jgi:hypothetical protein
LIALRTSKAILLVQECQISVWSTERKRLENISGSISRRKGEERMQEREKQEDRKARLEICEKKEKGNS